MGSGADDTDTGWLDNRVRLSREDLDRTEAARTDLEETLGEPDGSGGTTGGDNHVRRVLDGVGATASSIGGRARRGLARAGRGVRDLSPDTGTIGRDDGDDGAATAGPTGDGHEVRIDDATEFNWDRGD